MLSEVGPSKDEMRGCKQISVQIQKEGFDVREKNLAYFSSLTIEATLKFKLIQWTTASKKIARTLLKSNFNSALACHQRRSLHQG